MTEEEEIMVLSQRLRSLARAVRIPPSKQRDAIETFLSGSFKEDCKLANVLGVTAIQVKEWTQNGDSRFQLIQRTEAFTAIHSPGPDLPTGFPQHLMELLSSYAIASRLKTPPYVLSEYLCQCILQFEESIALRDDWVSLKN